MSGYSGSIPTTWIQEHPRLGVLLLIFYLLIAHRIFILFQRLFYSPLAKFPGPKLAAATSLYETYFNLVKNGKYYLEVERLHNIYGPIVRVNPYELSIRDSSFYDQLYVPASVRPTDGYHRFAAGVDFEGSHVFTTAHDLHRTRRKPLEPYFSRQGVAQLEPTLQDLAAKLVDRLQEAKETSNGKAAVVRLDHAMLCFTGDVINHVCCKNPTSLLDDTDFSAEFYESLHAPLRAFPVFEAFPSLIRVMRLVPDSVVAWLHPGSRFLKIFREKAERLIHEVKDEQGLDEKEEGCTGKRMTLFSHLIDGNALPEDEMNKTRLVNEAQVLLAAGTIGTSRVLDLTCFYVLASSDIRTRLAEELRAVMAEYPRVKPTRAQLEKLPYFQGVIKEGLRLGFGIMRRLPRVSPTAALKFKEWTIPAGTPVGMSAYMQHTDPSIFPRPVDFLPERWLPENVTPAMYHNFVPFAKGSRICLGMNLGYAEMNHMLAALFHEGGPKLDLFETDESDAKPVHDFIVPLPRLDSKGIRVLVR